LEVSEPGIGDRTPAQVQGLQLKAPEAVQGRVADVAVREAKLPELTELLEAVQALRPDHTPTQVEGPEFGEILQPVQGPVRVHAAVVADEPDEPERHDGAAGPVREPDDRDAQPFDGGDGLLLLHGVGRGRRRDAGRQHETDRLGHDELQSHDSFHPRVAGMPRRSARDTRN
jgi:hypothetical protein